MPWPPAGVTPEFAIEIVRDPTGVNRDATYGLRSATPDGVGVPPAAPGRQPQVRHEPRRPLQREAGRADGQGPRHGAAVQHEHHGRRPRGHPDAFRRRAPIATTRAAPRPLSAAQIDRILALREPGLHGAGRGTRAVAAWSSRTARRPSGPANVARNPVHVLNSAKTPAFHFFDMWLAAVVAGRPHARRSARRWPAATTSS